MKKTLFILAICFITISFVSVGFSQTTKPVEKSGKATTVQPVTVEKKNVKAKVEYTCPMHSEVIKDKPGKCPKCGMNLVKKETPKKAESKK